MAYYSVQCQSVKNIQSPPAYCHASLYFNYPQAGARSDSPTPSSVSTMSEWDDYNETLNQVLTWLLQAETQLNQQEPVSVNVDQVKEQFREHEEFMMILTSHQTSVGSVLEFGSQLINEGIVVGKEEKDIREQMALLSDRWENLRVAAMQRQSELHQHLMKLQQRQLKELADWLTKSESKMETAGPIGSDLDTVKRQVEEHKAFQEDLESQQQHVNSLSHMVVVVDESESESATADLEEQLATLGERWSAVCKWTEHRWAHLQEILTSWQQYRDEEQRLNKWLHDKETSLKDISVIDMGNKNQVELQIQKLRELEEELTQQQNSFGDFNLAAQRVAQTLEEDSPAIASIQDTMEDFNQRWNTIASMLNTKMKHFKGMEDQLQGFLKELEDNMSWITDAEMLLKPHMNPKKDLVESLDQAVKKRRTSITALKRQGEDLIQQSRTAGQSVVGLQQYITSFNERWESVSNMLDQQKNNLDFSERKKVFLEETQRIIIIITEITTYVEKIYLEMQGNPKELLVKIEIKQKELANCHTQLNNLKTEFADVTDPALKSAFETELNEVSAKLKTVEVLIEEKHTKVIDIVKSTPPTEFTDKMKQIQKAVDDVFEHVSKDFKYDEVRKMLETAEILKVKLKALHEQETHLKALSKQQQDMLKNLSQEKNVKYQKALQDLSRQWADCKKITEARSQRVNEAVTQTKELEIAMRETFHWMDDVDKFLEEITGTIAEGDAETIESQVQEVEALQQDIATVQKKVDSLIETCSLIINRAEPQYAESMKTKLTTLKQRWNDINKTTEKQKENLRCAGLKFQEVDAGVKEILRYLRGIEVNLKNEKFNQLDKTTLKTKVESYQEMESQLSSKDILIKNYLEEIKKLIASAAADAEPPPVLKDLELAGTMHVSISAAIKEGLAKLLSSQKEFDEFEILVRKMYRNMELLDAAIAKSSEKLDGDDNELQKCLAVLNELLLKFNPEELSMIEKLGSTLISGEVCASSTRNITDEFKARLDDTKERCKKVQYILEGELMKRQQLRKDLVQITQWLNKVENDTQEKMNGNEETTDEYIETLKEEISLNEALVASAERSIKELINTGRAENHQDLLDDLQVIQSRWSKLQEAYEVVKSKPKLKELEKKFSSLEGSMLSDIDNLKRKSKKVKMTSPEVADIQEAVETLEELAKGAESIHVDIEKLKSYAVELSSRTHSSAGIEQQVKEVEREYETVIELLKKKEKLLADALPLSESVYANLDTLDNWLKVSTGKLQKILISPLPSTPEDSINKIDNLVNEIKNKAYDVQELCTNAAHLGQMSEEMSFRAMETRVHDIREVYGEMKHEGDHKADVLQAWRKELDDYEKRVDDLNAWIDGRMSTLEAVGGVTTKFDVEMELERLKGLHSLINSKESELDILKKQGDEIATKGTSTLVEPYETKIFKRWDELEAKYQSVESLLQLKLKEIKKKEDDSTIVASEQAIRANTPVVQVNKPVKPNEPPPEKRRIISEEEVVIDEPLEIVEVQSAPASSFLDNLEDIITADISVSLESTPVTSTPLSSSASTSSRPPTKKYKQEQKLNFQQSVEEMILEIEEIEASLPKLRTDSVTGLKTIQDNVQEIEDHLSKLQPRFETITDEAGDTISDLQQQKDKNIDRQSIIRLSRKFSGIHADLELRRHSLKDADYKFTQLKNYLTDCQMWLAGAEKLLESEKKLENLKEIEDNIERYSARLESVNIRAEQLGDVCSDVLIPSKQIQIVNKRFNVVSYEFEKYQRPEEKVTTYRVSVETGDVPDAETRANVHVKLFGEYGNSDQLQLRQSETRRKKFQQGQVDLFTFKNQPWLGKLSKLRVWHDNEGTSPAWFLSSIYILDELSGRLFCYVFNTWLSKEHGAVLKELPVDAMALCHEASPDIMVKSHAFREVHWLFENFNPFQASSSSSDPSMKTQKELIQDIKHEIQTIEDIEKSLNHSCFTGKPFDDFSKQEETLKDVEVRIEKSNPIVTHFMMIRERYLSECSDEEMYEIDVTLTSMRSRWNAVNKEFKTRFEIYDKNVDLWKQFHDHISTLNLFLAGIESQLSGGEMTEDEVKDLESEIGKYEQQLNSLNHISGEIISQSSDEDAKNIREKLNALNARWNNATSEVTKKKMKNLLDDVDIKRYFEETDKLQKTLERLHNLIFQLKPHPVDEEDLESCLRKLKACKEEVEGLEETVFSLKKDAMKILSRSDLSLTQLDEIKSRSENQQKLWEEISTGLGNYQSEVEEKLARCSKFLEELEELSVWMSATRELLEGQRDGKPGFNVDPEIIKNALETRKGNVEKINKLLIEFKTEGQLISGQFPQEVGEKIARLNNDWQVIIRLAIVLRDQPMVQEEEQIVVESMQEQHSASTTAIFATGNFHGDFQPDSTDYTSTNMFDKNVAQLHDWLKIIGSRLKGLIAVVGDDDDTDTTLKKLTLILMEMENRKNDLEEVIEMGAALNMESNDESLNYAVDDKISKLKEHWEVVNEKVLAQKKVLEGLIGDWRRFDEMRLQLDNYIYKSEVYLNDNQKIGTTATELEEQIEKHKTFKQDILVWAGTYDNLQRIGEQLSHTYMQQDLTNLKNNLNEINSRWNKLEERSNARQQSLQDALDRLLLFHQNMISAMTWLSSAESKVAELDSLVEASQAEDAGDMNELQREMQKLEEDISSHQTMFHGLNETGNQIMMDLEVGEVRTALQSKLDDMNDRWNSLGVRVVDIRDRMSDGTGEWRQLLLDMQEIVDWLARADQELMSQQPIGNAFEIVQQQNQKHQDFKSKLNVRRVVIEQALEQGHNFLLKHQAQTLDSSYLSRNNDVNLVQRVATNLQQQLDHVESQWQELRKKSDKWQRSIDEVVDLMNYLLEQIESINNQLTEAEQLRHSWLPTSEIVVDNISIHLDEVKDLNERLANLEPQFENLKGTAKEIRHIHGIELSQPTDRVMNQLEDRWKRLFQDTQLRQENLQNLMGDDDVAAGSVLQGSVLSPWERGQAINKVPYFINHDTKTTTWDHPMMKDLYQTLSELNDVKYAAYRTSMKLRCIQKACCLDLITLNPSVTDAFDKHGYRSNNDDLIDVGEMINVLLTIFESIDKSRREAINIPQSVDMALNWLLNVYDSGRIGKLRILSFKIGLALLSRAKLEDKWRYLFRQIADTTGHADSKKLGLLLHDCVQIPRQLGEIAAFGGSNIEPSVRSCFEKAKSTQYIEASNFIDWTAAEPQSIVWMPVLHRLAAAETAKHDAKCQTCKMYPIVGFRYRCLKCFNYDMCQGCFWSGRITKSHRITHPMHQYSLATTTGEDMSDFVKLMKNKFKSRRYRNRPPKKLGYLPVQTVTEGSSIETPSIPSTPDMSFTFPNMNGSASSPDETRRHIDELSEEHQLIQQMCYNLNSTPTMTNGHTDVPKSPSQILASLDVDQRQDIDEMIRGLEDEHQTLQAEYSRLRDINSNTSTTSGKYVNGGNETVRDTELIAEAKVLREHKGKLEQRMQILEDHNRQLEAQLQKLRQLLEQPSSERHNGNGNVSTPQSTSITPALTPSSSYHGSPELSKNRKFVETSYSSENANEFRHVTSQIEHAFPIEQ